MRTFTGTPIREKLLNELPQADKNRFLVYIMGPYTTFDIDHVISEEVDASEIDVDLGAIPPQRDYQDELRHISDYLRKELGYNSFLAVDANIPPVQDAKKAFLEIKEDRNPRTHTEKWGVSKNDTVEAMTVVQQSKAFTEASNAVIFVLPKGGVRDGVNNELGSVLEAMGLEISSPGEPLKDPKRFRIYREQGLRSYTTNSFEDEYGIPIKSYSSQDDLLSKIVDFLPTVTTSEYRGELLSVEEELEDTQKIDSTRTITMDDVLDAETSHSGV